MSYGPSRPTGTIRVLVGVVVSAAFLIAWAVPAGAHTALKASSPKDGGRIDAAPSRLMMEFTAPLLSIGYRIVVQGPDGREYQVGKPLITNSTRLSQPLKPLGPPGQYRAEFRVVAYDGHPLTGRMGFTLTKPGPAAGGSTAVVRPAPLTAVSTQINNAPPWATWTAISIALLLTSGTALFGRRVTRGLH